MAMGRVSPGAGENSRPALRPTKCTFVSTQPMSRLCFSPRPSQMTSPPWPAGSPRTGGDASSRRTCTIECGSNLYIVLSCDYMSRDPQTQSCKSSRRIHHLKSEFHSIQHKPTVSYIIIPPPLTPRFMDYDEYDDFEDDFEPAPPYTEQDPDPVPGYEHPPAYQAGGQLPPAPAPAPEHNEEQAANVANEEVAPTGMERTVRLFSFHPFFFLIYPRPKTTPPRPSKQRRRTRVLSPAFAKLARARRSGLDGSDAAFVGEKQVRDIFWRSCCS